MAGANLKVKSGNRVDIMIDGAIVGLAQSADEQFDLAPEPASGCGDIHVQEWVPTMARHTVHLTNMILRTTGRLAAATENGDAALQGLVFDIMIMDKDSGMMRKLIKASFAQGSLEVRKHAITSASATFNALDASGSGG